MKGRIPTIFFVIAGILVLGITGFLLSDTGRKFYEPASQAFAIPCFIYGPVTKGICNNNKCPTNTSWCRPNALKDANPKKCLAPSTKSSLMEVLSDCCPVGSVVNGTSCQVLPSKCTAYSIYQLGTCKDNKPCAEGPNRCATRSLSGATQQLCKTTVDNKEVIKDCCGDGKTINATGTACVSSTVKCPYDIYSSGTCNNTPCVNIQKCAMGIVSGSAEKACKLNITGAREQIVDCCPVGKVLNGAKNACVDPAPTKAPCYTYGTKPFGTCDNKPCSTGTTLRCRANMLTGAAETKCKETSGDFESIRDCCAPNKVVNAAGTACVDPSPTTQPKVSCNDYITYALNYCTENKACATGSGQKCATAALSGANQHKCVIRIEGVDEVNDCCPIGQVISGSSCVNPPSSPTSSPTSNPPPPNPPTSNPTVTANPTIVQTTVVPTGDPTSSVSPTETPTVTPSFTPSGSVTTTMTPSADPSTSISPSDLPPTTSPTATRTPPVTHTPTSTGFEEDILVYIGGALYATGVIAFITARYLGVAKRKIVK